MSQIYEERQMMKPYIVEVFESFVGSFYSNLYSHLVEEMKNEQFVKAMMESQAEMKQQLQPIINQQFETNLVEMSSVEQIQLMKDAYIKIAYHCAEFQKKVATLLSEYFPGKYPDYFFSAYEIIRVLEEQVQQREKDLAHKEQQVNALLTQNATLNEQVQQLTLTVDETMDQYGQLEGQYEAVTLHLKIEQEKLTSVEQQNDELKHEVVKMHKTINILEHERDEIANEYNELEDKLKKTEETVQKLTEAEKQLSVKLRKMELEIEDLRHFKELAVQNEQAYKAQLEQMKYVTKALQDDLEVEHATIAKLIDAHNKTASEKQLLKEENESLLKQTKNLNEMVSAYKNMAESIEQEKVEASSMQESTAKINELSAELAQVVAEKTALENETKTLQVEIVTLQAEKQDLEDAKEQMAVEHLLAIQHFDDRRRDEYSKSQQLDEKLLELHNTLQQEKELKNKIRSELEQCEIRAKSYQKEAQKYVRDLEVLKDSTNSKVNNLQNELEQQKKLVAQYQQKAQNPMAESFGNNQTDLAASYERLKERYQNDVKKLRDEMYAMNLKLRQQPQTTYSTGHEAQRINQLEDQLAEAEKTLEFYRSAADQIGKRYRELLKKSLG